MKCTVIPKSRFSVGGEQHVHVLLVRTWACELCHLELSLTLESPWDEVVGGNCGRPLPMLTSISINNG